MIIKHLPTLSFNFGCPAKEIACFCFFLVNNNLASFPAAIEHRPFDVVVCNIINGRSEQFFIITCCINWEAWDTTPIWGSSNFTLNLEGRYSDCFLLLLQPLFSFLCLCLKVLLYWLFQFSANFELWKGRKSSRLEATAISSKQKLSMIMVKCHN